MNKTRQQLKAEARAAALNRTANQDAARIKQRCPSCGKRVRGPNHAMGCGKKMG